MRYALHFILLGFFMFIMAGCQWLNSDHEPTPPPDQETPHPNMNHPPKHKDPKNVVVLGLEGFKQEVVMSTFTAPWIKMEYEADLEVSTEEKRVRFYHAIDEAAYEVKLLDDPNQIESEQSLLMEQGYELANSFELENGEGYIYYLYEARHQVELYHIHKNNLSALVRFEFHESVADDYTFVFDYMLDSMVFNTAASKGD